MEKILALIKKNREIIMYLVFGVLTTLVNLVCYWFFTDICKIHYLVSTALAWVLSVLFAYITNRIWVFQSGETGAKAVLLEMAKFFGCRVLSEVVELSMMFVCVSLLSLPDKPVKLIATVIVIILNYIFSKLLVFKRK